MKSNSPISRWARIPEAGTYIGIQILLLVFRFLGRPIFSFLLYFVMGYFFVVRTEARQSSIEYLRNLHYYAPGIFLSPPGLRTSFQHFLQFGEAILDKAIAWAGNVSVESMDVIDKLTYRKIFDDPRGRLIIGSHFGNLEFCRGFASRYRDVKINALVHDLHAAKFTRAISRLNKNSQINIIQVTQLDVPTLLLLKSKVDNGEWVVITGDRIPVIDSMRGTVEVEFLGRLAPFPVGPYILATVLQCPVNLLFAYRDGKLIKIKFETFADRIELDREKRSTQLRQWVQEFANRLEKNCCIAPLQWFNFYPFWNIRAE